MKKLQRKRRSSIFKRRNNKEKVMSSTCCNISRVTRIGFFLCVGIVGLHVIDTSNYNPNSIYVSDITGVSSSLPSDSTMTNKILDGYDVISKPNQKIWDEQYDKWLGPPVDRPHDEGDWWRFNIQSGTSSKRPQNVRTKAETDLATAREYWYQKEILDKNKSLTSTSNALDANYCVQHRLNIKELKWTPPPQTLCHWKNTAIFWHSMHGTMVGRDFREASPLKHWMWEYANELEKEDVPCSCPNNVAFVFAHNSNNPNELRIVERSYQKCNTNCHYFHVGQNYAPWDWYGKIGPTYDLIRTPEFQSQFPYVVLTDANDQTLTRSPHDIVESFELYDADVVVGGEATNYPHWQNTEKNFENAVSPWSRHHQHINAGGMMAKTKAFVGYLELAKHDYEQYTKENADEIAKTGKNRWRDQTWVKTLHLNHYPKIKVDSLAKLWTRVDLFLNDL